MTATAIPPATNVKGYSKYPLMKLAVGESFFIPVTNPRQRKAYQNAVLQAAWKNRHSGKKFTTRIVEGGVRVWRTN